MSVLFCTATYAENRVSDKGRMIVDIQKMSGLETVKFSANGSLLYRISFDKIAFENSRIFYFTFRGYKTLAIKNLKIEINGVSDGFEKPETAYFPARFDGFEAKLHLVETEIIIESPLAKMANIEEIRFSKLAKLVCGKSVFTDITKIAIDYKNSCFYAIRANGSSAKIDAKTRELEFFIQKK